MKKKYQISIDRDENNIFVGEIVWLPACYTQAKTIPELLSRMVEVIDGSVELLNDINLKNNFNTKFNVSLEIDYA